MSLKSRQEPMKSFNHEFWSRFLADELKRRQEAWDHLMKLYRMQQLREICGVPHEPEYVKVKVNRESIQSRTVYQYTRLENSERTH